MRPQSFALVLTIPPTLYAGTFEVLFHSRDGGQRWTGSRIELESSRGCITGVEVDPTAPDTVFVGVASRLYKSSNGWDT